MTPKYYYDPFMLDGCPYVQPSMPPNSGCTVGDYCVCFGPSFKRALLPDHSRLGTSEGVELWCFLANLFPSSYYGCKDQGQGQGFKSSLVQTTLQVFLLGVCNRLAGLGPAVGLADPLSMYASIILFSLI
jgi:hypothetical protein